MAQVKRGHIQELPIVPTKRSEELVLLVESITTKFHALNNLNLKFLKYLSFQAGLQSPSKKLQN